MVRFPFVLIFSLLPYYYYCAPCPFVCGSRLQNSFYVSLSYGFKDRIRFLDEFTKTTNYSCPEPHSPESKDIDYEPVKAPTLLFGPSSFFQFNISEDSRYPCHGSMCYIVSVSICLPSFFFFFFFFNNFLRKYFTYSSAL